MLICQYLLILLLLVYFYAAKFKVKVNLRNCDVTYRVGQKWHKIFICHELHQILTDVQNFFTNGISKKL